MLSNEIICYLLLIHTLADFGLQTDEQAKNKGEGNSFFNRHHFYHVGDYSLVWFLACIATSGLTAFTIVESVEFTIITFICHYTTDWFTSRIGKPFWEKGDLHNGFLVVGLDQLLHFYQLIFTMSLLMPNQDW